MKKHQIEIREKLRTLFHCSYGEEVWDESLDDLRRLKYLDNRDMVTMIMTMWFYVCFSSCMHHLCAHQIREYDRRRYNILLQFQLLSCLILYLPPHFVDHSWGNNSNDS